MKRDKGQIMTSAIFVLMLVLVIFSWGFRELYHRNKVPPSAVPHVDPIFQQELPSNKAGEIQIVSDLSKFDLRFWKPVPLNLATSKPVSPANYSNYLRIKKNKPVQYLYAHYATSGAGIDLQCNSHPFVVLSDQQDNYHRKSGDRNYVAKIDISKEKVGDVFPVLVDATYWNGFRNEESEDASTYTDDSSAVPEELSILVLFPDFKPGKKLFLKSASTDEKATEEGADSKSVLEASEASLEKNGRYAYWRIRNKKPGYHYQMKWDW